LYIGAARHDNTTDNYFSGKIDEARISNIARSADWIATEYNTESSPSSFYGVGSSTAVPKLTSLSPTTGSAGTSVTITGTNFGSTQGSSTVAFSGVTTIPTSWSNTQIVAPVPGATITGNVVVNVANLNSNGLTFTDTSAGILALSPASGSIGTTVTIIGANFGSTQGSSAVTLNGTAVTPISWSDTQIVVPVPSGGSSGYIVATVSGAVTNGVYFTVTVPVIDSLTPSSGPTGTSVSISGSNFGATQGSSTVTFNGVAATPTSWSSMSIVVPVPAAAYTGNVVATEGVASSNGVGFSVVPNITSLSPPSGLAGATITITGTGFGPTQGTSTVTFNGALATPTSWSNTTIVVPVPGGATRGNVVVTVAGLSSIGAFFAVLPTGWLDQDVGTVAVAGSAAYSSGTFTVNGSGSDIYGSADGFHFAYQPLSGDGTIVARLVSLSGGGGSPKFGVMVRETLTASSTHAFTLNKGTNLMFSYRTTTGGSTTEAAVSGSLPYWVKVVRSGSTFSGYLSSDGVNWVQVGSSQTISMATNIYIGLAVTGNGSSLATGTFDSVSITSLNTYPGGISGTITSAAGGSAVSGAQIQVSKSGTVKATLVSDVNGHYGLANLIPGGYDVTVSAAGFGTSANPGVVVLSLTNTTLNVSLSTPGTISGTVTQSGGTTPIAGATVQAFVGPSIVGSATSDSSGNYSITGLNAGTYQVQAFAGGYVPVNQSESVTASSTTTANFALQSQGSGAVSYVYDILGRLVGVVNPAGYTAIYSYDAVGNLLSISQQASSQLSIITFTPISGPIGTTVRIYGTGFGSTTSLNTVKFNGTTAVVQSATPTQLAVTVPTGATTGSISVTTSAGTITSSASFTVTN
jgi:YD repeat-containing protein